MEVTQVLEMLITVVKDTVIRKERERPTRQEPSNEITREILNDTVNTFEKIISWCGLSRNSIDLEKFAKEWRQKQQYVLDEHKLILDIVDATINNVYMEIPQNLNIFAQAIIQQRLRRAGYELQCDGLNDLPSNTTLLHKLLDNTLTLHTG